MRGRRDADEGKIRAHVLDAAHAHERGRDSRRRADKLHGALGVGFHSQRGRHERRQAARKLSLKHRGAGHERDAQLGRGSDNRHARAVERLIGARQGFGHPQVARQLHEAKMVRSSGDVPRDRFHRGERKKILGVFALAECVPGGQPVEMNFRRGHGGFQKFKRGAQARVEHFARHFAQLRFRIVQVIHVNRFDAQIAAAALELVGNKFRRHRVASGGDVAFAQNSGFHVFAIEIFAGVGGHVAVRREESALRANHEFLARIAAPRKFRKRRAHGTLRTLEAVVDRGVDHVHAGFHGLDNRSPCTPCRCARRALRDTCRSRAKKATAPAARESALRRRARQIARHISSCHPVLQTSSFLLPRLEPRLYVNLAASTTKEVAQALACAV